MRGHTLFLLIILGLIGSISFFVLRDDTPLDVQPVVTASGSVVTDSPCAPPGMTREACFWLCDEIASSCVQVTSVGGVACFECRDRRPPRCEPPTLPEEECLKTCTETCTFQYLTQSRARCSTCDAAPVCQDGTFAPERCQRECENQGLGECVLEPGSTAKSCYRCVPAENACAADQYRTIAECQSRCDGACVTASNGCVGCVTCGEGAFANRTTCCQACETDCVAVSEAAATCWECPAGCDERCAERGYEVERSYDREVEQALEATRCVSGVQVAMARASFGECSCSKQPELIFDTTIPVCAGTICGDVTCGLSSTCKTPEGVDVTASCRWRGWKTLGDFRYQAQIQVDLD